MGEGLGSTVDLVVGLAGWEHRELVQIVSQPGGIVGKIDPPASISGICATMRMAFSPVQLPRGYSPNPSPPG